MISEGNSFVILHKFSRYLTLRIVALARRRAADGSIHEAEINRLMGRHL